MSKISVVGEHPLYAALTRQIRTADGKEHFRDNLRNSGLVPTEDPDVLSSTPPTGTAHGSP